MSVKTRDPPKAKLTPPVENPFYAIADALGMDLRISRITGNVFGGDKNRYGMVGPFVVTMPVRVRADETSYEVGSVVIKFRKHLWGYMINRPTIGLDLLLFDSKAAGIKTDEIAKYTTGDTLATVQKIQPYVKAAFAYDPTGHGWVSTTVDAVVARQPAKSP